MRRGLPGDIVFLSGKLFPIRTDLHYGDHKFVLSVSFYTMIYDRVSVMMGFQTIKGALSVFSQSSFQLRAHYFMWVLHGEWKLSDRYKQPSCKQTNEQINKLISPSSDIVWNADSPYKLDKPYGGKYSTLDAALEACVMAKGCTGVNFDGLLYTKCKGTKKSIAVGITSFTRGGKLVVNRGYTWDFKTGYKIVSGYYDGVTYRTASAAMNRCAGSYDCNGINKVGSNKFRLMTGITIKKQPGSSCYVQGSEYLEKIFKHTSKPVSDFTYREQVRNAVQKSPIKSIDIKN
jgi:hypothetical protein